MKLQVRELQQQDVVSLAQRIQPMQYESAQVSASQAEWAETVRTHGPHYSVFEGDKCIACGGLIDFASTGRAVAWALIAANTKHNFISLYRISQRFMALHMRRRIEAYIDPNHDAARRLVEVMGFRYEGLMRQFEADGQDRELWARILT